RDFGDAEIARLIAPRALIVEATRTIEVTGPPTATRDRRGAAPVGTIVSPSLDAVRGEVERARRYPGSRVELGGIEAFAKSLGMTPGNGAAPHDLRVNFDPDSRMHRQFDQLVAHTQAVVRRSPVNRTTFWS